MQINFITYDLPYPLTSGGKIRAYHLLKGISKNNEVTLFSYYRSESQKKYLPQLKKELNIKEIKLYKRRNIWHPLNLIKAALTPLPLLSVSYLNERLRNDLLKAKYQWPKAFFHFEASGPAVYLPLLSKNGAFCIMGNENVEWQVYDRMLKHQNFFPLLRPFMYYDVWKMKHFEHKLYSLAKLNLGVSEKDCAYVKEISGNKCELVRNGVDIERLKKEGEVGKESSDVSIAFGGDLTYQQNSNALKWFLDKVLPELLKILPRYRVVDRQMGTKQQLTLNVVTLSKPSWFVDSVSLFRSASLADGSSNTGVEVKIYDDPDLFAPKVYAKSTIFIAPIRAGGGTNIKILESLAVKTPVVTTTHGAKAIGAVDQHHVLVADNAKDFAQAIVNLLSNKTLRDKIVKNGYELVSQNFSWEESSQILGNIYQDMSISSSSRVSINK